MKPYNNTCGPDNQRQLRQDVDGIKGDVKSTLNNCLDKSVLSSCCQWETYDVETGTTSQSPDRWNAALKRCGQKGAYSPQADDNPKSLTGSYRLFDGC